MKVIALSSASLRKNALEKPESLAIASEEESISKFEFSQLVNAFAKTLTHYHKPETFLPVLVGTNINSVIVYHAAILSRVPVALIDGNTNPAYLKSILAKMNNPKNVIVSSIEFTDFLNPKINQIFVERLRQDEFDYPEVDLEASAIVIFSSGSTGEPKGVIWSWKNLDDAFEIMTRYYAEGKDVRLGRVTSIAFASGAYQMLSAAADHNLHLINPSNSPDEIIEFANKNSLYQISFSSSLTDRIYHHRTSGNTFQCVREVLTYGESVSWEQIKKIRQLVGSNAEIRTSYGASEAPGFVLYYQIKPETSLGLGRVPIGNLSEVKNLELIPNFEDPAIYSVVVNKFVAKEYLGSPIMTSHKFTTNDRNEKCYHTGDLVRVDEKGVITFLGRDDDLIKINGRFVSPSEPESLLQVLPGIVNVAVLPHIKPTGETILAAHLVVSKDSELTPTIVYEYLLDNLSSHLVPGELIRHSELPLNINGKVDRKALQSGHWLRWKENEADQESTKIEKFVLTGLRKILNAHDLSLAEDVFGCGMDSLAALEFQVFAEEFGFREIPPSIFLENRTAQSIADLLVNKLPLHQSNFVSINKMGLASPYFIFPGAGVSAIFFWELAHTLGSNQPLIVIEPKGLHTSEPIEESLEEMAASMAREIAIRCPKGVIHLIGHSAGAAIACEVGIILSSMDRKVSMISLDAAGIANRVTMSTGIYKLHFCYRRIKDLVLRTPHRTMKSIQRRQKARNRNSYEFFTLHIGKLSNSYTLTTKLSFPILFLYCTGSKNRFFWKETEQLKFQEILGTHFTFLDSVYIADVTKKIRDYFSLRNEDASGY